MEELHVSCSWVSFLYSTVISIIGAVPVLGGGYGPGGSMFEVHQTPVCEYGFPKKTRLYAELQGRVKCGRLERITCAANHGHEPYTLRYLLKLGLR